MSQNKSHLDFEKGKKRREKKDFCSYIFFLLLLNSVYSYSIELGYTQMSLNGSQIPGHEWFQYDSFVRLIFRPDPDTGLGMSSDQAGSKGELLIDR